MKLDWNGLQPFVNFTPGTFPWEEPCTKCGRSAVGRALDGLPYCERKACCELKRGIK